MHICVFVIYNLPLPYISAAADVFVYYEKNLEPQIFQFQKGINKEYVYKYQISIVVLVIYITMLVI